MPYSVKGFFEINEDMVQILLMLEVLFAQYSKVEDLFCGASSGSEPSLFFSNYFFSLGFKPVQDDFQHDFARMTDEADSSVVLAELQVALFRECNNQRLSPWGRPFSCSPDPVIVHEPGGVTMHPPRILHDWYHFVQGSLLMKN